MLPSSKQRYFFIGSLSGVLANVLLGFSSVFWKYIGSFSAVELVAYRVYLSLLTVFLILCACKGVGRFFAQLNIRLLFVHTLAALLLAVNWGVFIWASIHGRVLESSFGYLVAPIISIAAGVVLYKEPVTICKVVAVAIMIISVLWLLVLNDELVVKVYLTIGISWGGYSCLKKMTSLNVFNGLFLESSVLAFFYTLILLCSDLSMAVPEGFGLERTILVFSCGVVSIVPLALFSLSAKRLTMTSMGLLQFVLPVTQFFVAAVIYRQEFSTAVLCVLLVVISGLALVVLEPFVKNRLSRKRGQYGA
jgi:chloramphenicol-sensitive protein RarD